MSALCIVQAPLQRVSVEISQLMPQCTVHSRQLDPTTRCHAAMVSAPAALLCDPSWHLSAVDGNAQPGQSSFVCHASHAAPWIDLWPALLTTATIIQPQCAAGKWSSHSAPSQAMQGG